MRFLAQSPVADAQAKNGPGHGCLLGEQPAQHAYAADHEILPAARQERR